ncbi:hypothetical protein [Prosthecomicrobium sp. N25]|uniref:hypothetical protein n=1 Tax=Prosthecomicrobium sp. N25 TaxID=3129254 RepID=UPI0030788F69
MNKPYLAWYALLAAIILASGAVPVVFSSGGAHAEPILATIVLAIVFPPLMIWLLGKTGYPIGRAVSCPTCGSEMPFLRKPTTLRMALLGGYKCKTCGTETDAWGRATVPR